MPTYTGVLTELGGAELGQSGHEKPRKVVIKSDPNQENGKTFRTWSDSDAWFELQDKIGHTITVDFEIEQRQGGPKGSYKQNVLKALVGGAGGGEPQVARGSVANGEKPPSAYDWSVPSDKDAPEKEPPPPPTPEPPPDQWEAKTLEIEAAWAIKAILDKTPGEIKESELLDKAMKLVILKRRLAYELSK